MNRNSLNRNLKVDPKTESETTPVLSKLGQTTIQLQIRRPRPGGPTVSLIDLSQFMLPEVPFTNGIVTVASRPDFAQAIYDSINGYIARNGHGNHTHRTAKGMVKTLCKFFEYLWLNGCYRLDTCTKEVLDRLPEELARGGWAAALNVRQRGNAFIEANTKEKLGTFVADERGRDLGLKKSFPLAIGSNVEGAECTELRQMVLNALNLPVGEVEQRSPRRLDKKVAGASAHSIIRELNTINQLADQEDAPALQFVPFPNAQRIARRLGRPGGRTPSMRPENVGAWLRESFRTIDRTAEPLQQFLTDLHSELVVANQSDGKGVNGKKRAKVMTRVLKDSHLSREVGQQVYPTFTKVSGKHEFTTVGQLIRDLMSSCFMVIALLNGRRKQEVQSPQVGLTNRSLTVVNSDLGLYECSFYIAKTHRCYVPFFVGDATVRAIRCLEQLSGLALAFMKLADEHGVCPKELDEVRPLFLVPVPWTSGSGGGGRWFDFSTLERGAAHNLASRIPSGDDLPIRAHMFRRAYALIFHYRYEDGDLLALKQQLGHLDIEMTLIYVTWAADKAMGGAAVRAYGRLTPEQISAWEADSSDLLSEIEQVSQERLRKFVEDILSGKSGYSGGFPRLIQRFHQRFGARLDYQLRTRQEKAGELTKLLEHRGHAVVPFEHGNCVAARGKPNRGAGCFSADNGGINRQNASPEVCGECPYHALSLTHVALMEGEADEIEKRVVSERVQTLANQNELRTAKNLRRWIELHRSRIGANLEGT